MPTVAIVQKVLTHYRKPFFEDLKQALRAYGIDLRLIYGSPNAAHARKKDTVDISWAQKIENITLQMRDLEIVWQPCLGALQDADLVIVEQANSLLLNYLLLLSNRLGLKKLALWGHGRNFQRKTHRSLAELVKRRLSRTVHWWFAYNDLSSQVVSSFGFPPDRITSVQNAIDTTALIEGLNAIKPVDVDSLREKFAIVGDRVCIFSGAMYKEKRLRFLLDSLLCIKKQVPDFEMIFLGDGPDAPMVRSAAEKYGWIHYIGPRFGIEKIPFFCLSKLLLMPGLVGLAVLDAFALEVPMVTTNIPYHSPEIDYLCSGVNGLIVAQTDAPQSYADAVSHLLLDPVSRQGLVEGCRGARQRYTLAEMVRRFSEGIAQALIS